MRKTSVLCLPVVLMLAGCGGFSLSDTVAGGWLGMDRAVQEAGSRDMVTRIAFGSCADEANPQPI